MSVAFDDVKEIIMPPVSRWEPIFQATDAEIDRHLHDKTEFKQSWSKHNKPLVAKFMPMADRIVHANAPLIVLPKSEEDARAMHIPIMRDDGELPAAYYPNSDVIILPPLVQFENVDELYAALFHEMSHWTGAKSRLGRPIIDKYTEGGVSLGDVVEEEFIAETSAAYITQALGICNAPRRAHYIRQWFHNLNKSPCLCCPHTGPSKLKRARIKAREAADYILSKAA